MKPLLLTIALLSLPALCCATESLLVWNLPPDEVAVSDSLESSRSAPGIKPSILRRVGLGRTGERPACWSISGFSETEEINPSAYIEFTVTPEDGARVRLDQIDFYYWMNMNRGLILEIRSSADNYQSVIDTFWPDPYGDNSRQGVFGFSNLTEISTPITFRVFGYNSSGENFGQFFIGGSPNGEDFGGDFVVSGTLLK